MKTFLVLSSMLVVVFTLADVIPDSYYNAWDNFKVEHAKDYETEVEEEKRMAIFFDNLKKIREHNSMYERGESTYQAGVNKYSDMTSEEIAATMNGFTRRVGEPRQRKLFVMPADVDLPASVDWRKKGAVTGVKDQGQCGSCWAFSAIATLESHHFLKTGKLVSLSEQNIMDCSSDDACRGGYPAEALKYVKKNGGVDTEASYEYEGKQGKCRYDPKNKGATDKGVVQLPQGDEKALQAAVATKGPISVAIDAFHDEFTHYDKGILQVQNCSKTILDHAVLVVGYGTTKNGEDYWLVKNSWGKSWGMEGYVLMPRNKENYCGIASDALYPEV